MTRYRYSFQDSISFDDIEGSLVLALLGAENLHGNCEVRLNAGHDTDSVSRTVVVDATHRVGIDLNKLFVGYLKHEFGSNSFTVERV